MVLSCSLPPKLPNTKSSGISRHPLEICRREIFSFVQIFLNAHSWGSPCASGQASARCPESRRVSGERGSPKSAVLGPRRRSGLSARLLTRPGRRCGGVRCRRPGAWSGASPAACGSSPPPPPSHPSCGGARPPRRFCTNKGGLRGASAAPPALRSAPARGGR